MKTLKVMGSACLLLLSSGMATAADLWTLQGQQSTINYVSIKSSQIPENNHFTQLSGSVSDTGALSIEIQLASVSTGIDIRNERMAKHFFKVADFATATLSAQLPEALMVSIKEVGVHRADVEATLSLHGAEKQYTVPVTIANTGAQLLVGNAAPILLSAEDFGLGAGLDKLQELAGLPSITKVVPVNATLVFKK